jgi:hypothetical protein
VVQGWRSKKFHAAWTCKDVWALATIKTSLPAWSVHLPARSVHGASPPAWSVAWCEPTSMVCGMVQAHQHGLRTYQHGLRAHQYGLWRSSPPAWSMHCVSPPAWSVHGASPPAWFVHGVSHQHGLCTVRAHQHCLCMVRAHQHWCEPTSIVCARCEPTSARCEPTSMVCAWCKRQCMVQASVHGASGLCMVRAVCAWCKRLCMVQAASVHGASGLCAWCKRLCMVQAASVHGVCVHGLWHPSMAFQKKLHILKRLPLLPATV